MLSAEECSDCCTCSTSNENRDGWLSESGVSCVLASWLLSHARGDTREANMRMIARAIAHLQHNYRVHVKDVAVVGESKCSVWRWVLDYCVRAT